MTIRFAIIGTGMISHIHAKAISALPDAELVCVVSRDIQNGSVFARTYGCRYTVNPDDMLNSDDIDAVCVCAPSGTHANWAMRIAECGKHVLVEKPIDISLTKAQETVRFCRANGVKFGVIFQLRFMEETQRAKRLLEQGVLGRMIQVDTVMKFNRTETYYQSSSWKGTAHLDGGGALINQGIHGIDLMLWLAGPVSSVTAQAHTLKHQIEVEDTVLAMVNFQNGAVGIVQAATSIYPDQPQLLSFHGTQGTLELEGSEVPFIRRLEVMDFPDLTIRTLEPPPDHLGEAHRLQIQDFIEAILENREPEVNGEEGCKSLELVSSIYQSSKEGRSVRP